MLEEFWGTGPGMNEAQAHLGTADNYESYVEEECWIG